MKYFHRILLTILFLAILGSAVWISIEAGGYYFLPQEKRPHHLLPEHYYSTPKAERPEKFHNLWKPGGKIGHNLGIIGSTMLMVLFIYSARKRIKIFRKLGKLSSWLNYHIFLGIAGPVLVTFHTAFKFGGLVSVSYWSMMAVMLSGFIGRYIYVKIPRRVDGKELTLQEFETSLSELKERLKTEYHLSGDNLELIDSLAGAEKIKSRGLRGLFTLLAMDMFNWLTVRKIISRIADRAVIPHDQISTFRHLLRQRIKAARQIAFWNTANRLFHYWHVIHKPFAYTMVIIMIIHVSVVEGWISISWLSQ
ncbi:MAG: hypothetical protein QF712_01755 [Candidatus Marinimicrobia bacterium]|jgi:hypothetical protein|nr:hypothetical protein [Candidatus Neomarinimicrobiota bacterium]|tara:strand:+ start:1086 stop:2009 length:924 start_codon:yes stop_codon:yes gene_type:complete